MSLYRRVSSRFARTILAQCRDSLLFYGRQHRHPLPIPSNQFHSLRDIQNKVVSSQVSLLHHSALNASAFRRYGFSSSASPETTEKETAQSGSEGITVEKNGATAKTSGDTNVTDQKEASSSEDKNVNNQKEESDSEDELSMEDLVKLVAEKEELLKVKHKEIETMQDKVLRTYAEMENVMDRTRREAENSKKFAIQSFAKTLLDVADNLGRAASVVKDSFSKVDASKDTSGAVPLLETLLKGVEMTEKQLTEVLKKFGVEKYDPTNEQFDPNRHNAVSQVPDASKPPGTVAVVLKVGYMLHDRVLRPAEVGVTVAVDNEDMNQSNEA
ncbi:grpE protein homolog 2, mitochondrial-like isoform X2 [Actinidia eriantha]|uniref:grpE protein homolog 2, mitochondrial-like isoform X2 n=1 Tax=Actinidia eriantha TaxID=165200 RepID=UPI002583E64F|nr:grpE protein homolog 2, mitochondrial-like isoform X2 [Actinidia eriantha]